MLTAEDEMDEDETGPDFAPFPAAVILAKPESQYVSSPEPDDPDR